MTLSFNASISSTQTGAKNILIPSPGNIKVNEFGLAVPETASVQIIGTYGVEILSGFPILTVKLFRDNVNIFTTKQSATIENGNFQNICFNNVDLDVPPGYYAYSATIEYDASNPSYLGVAKIVGPAILSGEVFRK